MYSIDTHPMAAMSMERLFMNGGGDDDGVRFRRHSSMTSMNPKPLYCGHFRAREDTRIMLPPSFQATLYSSCTVSEHTVFVVLVWRRRHQWVAYPLVSSGYTNPIELYSSPLYADAFGTVCASCAAPYAHATISEKVDAPCNAAG